VLPALVVDTALVSSETYKDLYAFVHDIRSIGPEPYFVRVDGMPKEVTFEDPLALLDWVEERAGASRSQKGRQKRAAKPAAPATTSSLGARLNAAKETSVALNKATDELNARLSLVEATLVDLNLGVSASIPLLEGTTLSFRKRADEWGFYVDADKSVPIQSASREARLAAVGCLESLIDELLTKTTSQLDQVQNGVATVDALLGELKGAVS
jgi:hypothetical protein